MNPNGVSGNLFSTTADQSGNSFSNYTSPSHMTVGWGINPSQLTPSYDAPYRPRFNGPSPYSSYQKPGFFGALGQTFNPFAQTPYWGNSIDQSDSSANAIGSNPFDAAARIGQRFVAPAVAYGLAQKIMTGVYDPLGMLGGNGGWAGSVSGSMARGLGRGLGMAEGGSALGMMGSVGSFAGGIALPMVVGKAVTATLDYAIFQPYARMRQIADDLRGNFSGVTFGDARGNVISGGGLGRSEAARMAGRLENAGAADMTWSSSQFAGISNMASKSGLLDGSNSKQIVDRIKGISEQIKIITAISKDPSIQGAIEELSKLRLGGASTVGGTASEAAAIYRKLGIQASVAGTSVQQIMSGVGLQSQYLYQMNGLTPVLGQLAGASAYAGFATARRNGVFSDAQFARMGGEEGATQSAVSGNLAGLMTPYNRMRQFNRYSSGINSSGVVNTISSFGSASARDPLGTSGFMTLYGGAMTSKQDKDGWGRNDSQAIAWLKNNGYRPEADGKWDPNKIAAVLKNVMGLTDQQIIAHASESGAAMNPDTISQNYAASNRSEIEQITAFSNQHGLGNTWFAKGKRSLILGLARKEAERNRDFVQPVLQAEAYVGDKWQKLMQWMNVGTSLEPAGNNLNGAVQGLGKVIGTGTGSLDSLSVLRQANNMFNYYSGNDKDSPAKTLASKLNGPGYEDLKKSLAGMDNATAFSKIREMMDYGISSGSLRASQVYKKGMSATDIAAALGGNALGNGFTPGSSMTDQERSGVAGIIAAKANDDARTTANAHNPVGWDKSIQVYNSLDSASKNLNEAANTLKSVSSGGYNSETKTLGAAWNNFKNAYFSDNTKNIQPGSR